MVDLSVQQEITKQLDRMPLELQRRVLDFAEALAQSRPKGQPGSELLRFAGFLDADSVREIKEAVEAECERVDLNEW